MGRGSDPKPVLILLLLLGTLSMTSSMPVAKAATTVTLSYDGLGPSTISLTWTQSGDLFFSSYTVQYSTSGSNGPWTVYNTINTKSQTSQYVRAVITPGGTSWWQVIDTDLFGTATSNTLQVSQPNAAVLTYVTPTATSVQFNWSNGATYGGLLAFGSYQLMESVNGGSNSAAATITAVSTLSYTINGLSSATSYSFYVITTDQCTACSDGTEPSSSNSNFVSFTTVSPLTVSVAATPMAVDVGQTVSFQCTAVGGKPPYSYSWTFGDGSTGLGETSSHKFDSEGTKTVSCNVTDSYATHASGVVAITVSPAPSVIAHVDHNAAAPGTFLTFTATTSGGPGSFTNYIWSFGDGTSGSGTLVSHAFTITGTFNVTVTVTDANGVTTSGNVTVTISNLSLTASVSTTHGLPNDMFTFMASATGGGGSPFSFAWNFGDGSSGVGAQISHSYAAPGNYTAAVTVTDSLGGKKTIQLATVLVEQPLTVEVQLSPSNPTPGEAVILTAVNSGGSGGYSCTWNFGDSTTGNGCSISHTWATSGSYSVTLNVTDSEGHNTLTSVNMSVQTPQTGGLLGLSWWVLGRSIAVVIIAVAGVAVLLRKRGPAS